MTMPIHMGLTADIFVVRNGRFLTLERGPGRGEGVWYLPGGLVERGEDPLSAAVRETQEETALVVRDVASCACGPGPRPRATTPCTPPSSALRRRER